VLYSAELVPAGDRSLGEDGTVVLGGGWIR